MSKVVSSMLGIAGIALLLGVGIVFPAMADSLPLRIVADSIPPEGKAFVSVDFDQDGICDEQAVLISISTNIDSLFYDLNPIYYFKN